MALNLVLGKTKTKKSKYIFNKIDELVLKNKQVILFVPSQNRMQTENNYMRFQNSDGIIGFKVTTISEYINKLIEELNVGIEDRYITDFEKKLIISKIISNDNKNILKSYTKVKNKQGFLETLSIYMDLFRKEGLENISKEIQNIDNDAMFIKLNELIEFSKIYNQEIDNNFKDSISNTSYVCENIKQGKIDLFNESENISIFFDGYNNFSKSELLFISTLLSKNIDITFGITTDLQNLNDIYNLRENNFDEDMFYISKITIKELLNIANKNNTEVEYIFLKYEDAKVNKQKDIKTLMENIFQNHDNNFNKIATDNINIELLSNEYDEINYIANDISKKIRKNKDLKYSDFAIYLSNIDEFSYIIDKVFKEYKIPVYIDKYTKFSDNILVKYISKILDKSIYTINTEGLIECIKLRLNDIEIDEINYFENYILEFNIRPYNFQKEFKLNTLNSDVKYDLERINKTRNKINDIYFATYSKITKATKIEEYINIIYSHIIDNKVSEKYNEILTKLENSSDLEKKYMASNFAQVYDKLSEILNSMYKIYRDKEIKLEEFSYIFDYAKIDIKLKTVPNSLDEVKLLDINTSRENEVKNIYIVGLNDGIIPTNISEDVIFSDTELEELKKVNIEFKNTTISKINMQLFNIYEAISSAKEKITFTLCSFDITGKTLRPSVVVNNIKQILDIKIHGNIVSKDKLLLENIYSQKELLEYVTNNIREIENTENGEDTEKLNELIKLYEYLKRKENISEIIKYIKNDGKLKKNTIKRIYKKELYTSISKLELFKKCPFSYYIKYGLKLNERKVYELSKLDIGSFMHNVLDRFSKRIIEDNVSWDSITCSNYNYKNIVKEIIEEEFNSTFYKHIENIRIWMLKQKLENNMIRVIKIISDGFLQSSFRPYGSEVEFSNNGVFAPIEIKIDEDTKMKVIGKIDRIDTAVIENNTYARIIDYKSSKRELNLDDIKEGISLQLATYLDAFILNNQKENKRVIPAAMLYFDLSNNIKKFDNYNSYSTNYEKEIVKELRMKGIFLKDINVISKMDTKLETDNRLIDISPKTLNSKNDSKKALPEEDFIKLCSDMKNILKEIGTNIIDGIVKIDPLDKKDVCKYCEFSSVCRKNIRV